MKNLLLALVLLSLPATVRAAGPDPAGVLGYYRYPAVYRDTVVFTAEGDLWRTTLAGGVARRLTSHLGEESRAAISPDGRWVAFSATYDGPTEAYVMPLAGGLPKRLTWDGLRDYVVGWTPQGQVLVTTRRGSGLPAARMVAIDPASGLRREIPLDQISDAAYDDRTLVFTRQEPNISHTRRYRGGTIQQLWTWNGSSEEARPLLAGDSAASKRPMPWKGRVYFIGDRSLDMNLWSVARDGSDARQHTFHRGWDVRGASLSEGRIVYALGADLRVYDIEKNEDRVIPIRLGSDLDQLRERWVVDPVDYVTTARLSPNGDRVALTARGQVFVVPVEDGRLVQVTRDDGQRWRQARFLPDGKSLVALSDASDEVEWWKLPANGVGDAGILTRDGKVLRWDGVPSPDGKWLAHWNKDQELWLLDLTKNENRRIAVCREWGDFQDIEWSPDSRWLAYVRPAPSQLFQVLLYDTRSGDTLAVTSDRWDSYSPAFSPDGKWLWFLSDRRFESSVGSPWGSGQPDPFFDRKTKIFGVALQKSFRSPWAKLDELHAAASDEKKDAGKSDAKKSGADAAKPAVDPVVIDTEGLAERLIEVPADPGNNASLTTDGKRLYWLDRESDPDGHASLKTFEIARKNDGVGTILSDVRGYELSADRKKLLVRKGDAFYAFDAGAKAPDKLDKSKLPLGSWNFTVDPRAEFQQMFREGWRLERDYFYDRAMHGVDWKGQRSKFQPLADRVTTRDELSDLFEQMVGELSALHMYVYGGDLRKGADQVFPAGLGARLERDDRAGGWRIAHIHRTDPDEPGNLGPLAKTDLDVKDGDVILAINGVPSLSVADPGELLRGQAGKQVLLRLQRGNTAARDVIVTPVTPSQETNLRFTEWEYTRRLRADSLSAGRVGYVHLRAMGANDMARWMRDYYPVFQRDGLIIDLRNNRGGNIDSWILGKLMRQVWHWFQPRIGRPVSNMPFAFEGKLVVIVDPTTVSDGEDFAEGFRRLGLGKVLGARTWGGEIWLSSSNFLVDRGIATAAEVGLFLPESQWYIEGHGVDPDIVVDNLPYAVAQGRDAQLDAAVRYLMEEIARSPRKEPRVPRYPDKSGRR